MKRIIALLFVISTALLTISCDDKETPKRPDIPEFIDDSGSYSYELLAAAGSSVSMPQEMKLGDFEKLETYTMYVREAKIRTSSKIVISGVTAGKHKLQDLCIKVKGTNIKKEFGTITKDGEYNFLEDNEFIRQLMNKLIAAKTITLELTTTSENIIQKDVKLTLQIDARFVLK